MRHYACSVKPKDHLTPQLIHCMHGLQKADENVYNLYDVHNYDIVYGLFSRIWKCTTSLTIICHVQPLLGNGIQGTNMHIQGLQQRFEGSFVSLKVWQPFKTSYGSFAQIIAMVTHAII